MPRFRWTLLHAPRRSSTEENTDDAGRAALVEAKTPRVQAWRKEAKAVHEEMKLQKC